LCQQFAVQAVHSVLHNSTKVNKSINKGAFFMYELTNEEKERVQDLIREIRKTGFADIDQFRMREDFYGLYCDIVLEFQKNIKRKSKNIETFYEYSELLDDIAGLTTPEMAYIAGKEAKEAGIDLDDGIDIFMCQIEDDICDSDLTTQADALCEELKLALGAADKILDEFILMRAKIDVINLNMEQFFQAGYGVV